MENYICWNLSDTELSVRILMKTKGKIGSYHYRREWNKKRVIQNFPPFTSSSFFSVSTSIVEIYGQTINQATKPQNCHNDTKLGSFMDKARSYFLKSYMGGWWWWWRLRICREKGGEVNGEVVDFCKHQRTLRESAWKNPYIECSLRFYEMYFWKN